MGAPRMSKEENEALRHQIAGFMKREKIEVNDFADRSGLARPRAQGFMRGAHGVSPKIGKKLARFIREETREDPEAAKAAQDVRLRLRKRLEEFGGRVPDMAKEIEGGISARELRRYLDAGPVSPRAELCLARFAGAAVPNGANGTHHIVKRDAPVETGGAMTAEQLALSWGLDAIRFVLAQAQRELRGERNG